MQRFATGLAVFLSTFVGLLSGQHAVDPAQRYHRLICLVHLTGSGTQADPVRPEHVPAPGAQPPSDRSGIIAWAFQITDDGKMAIVHYVAVDRKAFAAIFADTRPEVLIFEIGKDSRAAIEAAMQRHKQGFSLDKLQVVAQ